MKWILVFSIPFLSMQALHAAKSKQPQTIAKTSPFTITPPKGWECIQDPTQLPQKVKFIYIGNAKKSFTPSINLASELTNMALDEYVNTAKGYHESQSGARCSLLGDIITKAGTAKLMQIDRSTEWGEVRFLQAALIREGEAYVITATCLREEFPSLSTLFLKTIQSFAVEK